MAQARTSFLEAVNRVLQMLGEAPVNSLTGQFGLAQQAQDMLNDTSRRIQAEGWSFNTDYQRLLQRDGSNQILVGGNVSKVVVDPYVYTNVDVVQRGDKLYDRRGNTYTFTLDLKADVTYLLEWEELPEYAREYITIKAGRHLQEAIVGSGDLTKINLTAEAEARAAFMEQETTASQHNMLRGNPNHTSVFMTFMPAQALRR
jgi:Tail tubular protein